jgi:drug/metabolite transporter (DMT)-like permease
MPDSRESTEPDPQTPLDRSHLARRLARRLPSLMVSIAVSAVLPLLFYSQLQHLAGSEVKALLIAAAIPVAFTAGKLAVRRRLDPIGVLSVAGFAVGIVLVALTGSPFALKIREPVLAGAIGAACLASMLIRRPLALLLLPRSRPWIPGMTRRSAAYWITGIWGVVLPVDAAVGTLLATFLPTRTFLAVHQAVALAFVALGIGCLIWRKRHPPAAQPGDPAQAGS